VSEVTEIRLAAAALGSLRERVAEATTALVWLLDADAEPADDALAALLDHAPGPAAALPVDAAGHPVKPLMGRVTESDDEGILAAVARRCLPLRHIPVTSLLVERELALAPDPPDPDRFGWYAGDEWTARLFALRRGVLVPASRVRVDGAAAGSPVHALRAARSAGWRNGETARELHRSIASTFR
jgi:hypothetical protein